MVPFLQVLSELIGRGVEIRLIHAKETGPNFREDFDRYPRLFKQMELLTAALKKALHDGAVKALGGKDNLQSEVEVVENFYLAKDGLHFVYNEYEIACYAAGPVRRWAGRHA